MISWRHTWKEILGQRTRVLLTLFAIAWGTTSITCMLAIGEGLRITFGKALQNVGATSLIIHPGTTTRVYAGIKPGMSVPLNFDDLKLLQTEIPGIEMALGSFSFNPKITYQNKSAQAMAQAVTPDFQQINPIVLKERSRFINQMDMQQQNRVAVLGQNYIDNLFSPHDNPLGKLIKINGEAFTVIGVMPNIPESIVNGIPNYFLVYIPVSTYQVLTQAQNYDNIIVVPKKNVERNSLQESIRHFIALHHHLDPNDLGIINIEDRLVAAQTFMNFFLGLQIFLGIIGGITLTVSGIGIANVMLASISHATRDIGVRMAIGAKSYHIILHYLIEAMIVTFAGGIIGIILSWVIVTILKNIPIHSQFFTSLGSPQPILSWSVILTSILVLGLIGFLAGFFPANKAAKIDPLEALRHE